MLIDQGEIFEDWYAANAVYRLQSQYTQSQPPYGHSASRTARRQERLFGRPEDGIDSRE